MKSFAIKLSGPAGAGMMQAGETLSKALNRLGFYTLMYPEYPSRIRGGDNNVLVVFSSEKYLAPVEKVDLLLAFGRKNFERHEKELGPTSSRQRQDFVRGKGFEGEEIGLNKIAKKLGNPLVANTAGLGFIWKVLGFDLKTLEEQIEEEFKEKEEIKKLNLEAARRGYGIGVSSELWVVGRVVRVGVGNRIINLTGNEALVEGILKANCEFAAIYPMTPINSILTMLARLDSSSARLAAKRARQVKSKVQVFRPEDEIAGIMSAIGASYAGQRAMVATSGGGFSLMIEGLGVAGAAEIPIVVVVGQRTGPSTGMATFSSQADLNFAIYGGHGEFPRIVLAPGDLKEAYFLGTKAFNLAEKYQVPVILLTDKYLAESRFSVEKEELEKIETSVNRGKLIEVRRLADERDGPARHASQLAGVAGRGFGYKRYEFTKDGISPRAFPGQVAFLTNSYEHDEYGFSADDSENRKKMMKKRMGKLKGLNGGFEPLFVPAAGGTSRGKGFDPEIPMLVGWGSTKEIILDFLKDHAGYNFLHIWRPWPFPREAVEILKRSKRIVCVEGNYSGQLADLIERFTFRKIERVLKDDGRPFFKNDLHRFITDLH